MEQKSKLITGLITGKILKQPSKYYSDSEKQKIIQEMLSTGCTKRDIWEKYTGQSEEHGQLLRWMRKLGYDESIPTRIHNFVAKSDQMGNKKKTQVCESTFETLQLQKRIEELEKQLKEAEMKAIAFSTMVDIAEKEFDISIRKKFNTKPLKK